MRSSTSASCSTRSAVRGAPRGSHADVATVLSGAGADGAMEVETQAFVENPVIQKELGISGGLDAGACTRNTLTQARARGRGCDALLWA